MACVWLCICVWLKGSWSTYRALLQKCRAFVEKCTALLPKYEALLSHTPRATRYKRRRVCWEEHRSRSFLPKTAQKKHRGAEGSHAWTPIDCVCVCVCVRVSLYICTCACASISLIDFLAIFMYVRITCIDLLTCKETCEHMIREVWTCEKRPTNKMRPMNISQERDHRTSLRSCLFLGLCIHNFMETVNSDAYMCTNKNTYMRVSVSRYVHACRYRYVCNAHMYWNGLCASPDKWYRWRE